MCSQRIPLQDLAEMPPVIQARKGIRGRQLLQFLERFLELLVLDGDLAHGLLLLLVEAFVVLLDFPGFDIFLDDQGDGEEVVAGLDDVVVSAGADGIGGGLADIFAGDDDHGAVDLARIALRKSMPEMSGRLKSVRMASNCSRCDMAHRDRIHVQVTVPLPKWSTSVFLIRSH